MLYYGCVLMYVCCKYRESVIAECMCDSDVAMLLCPAMFLAGSFVLLVAGAMSFEERRLANVLMGFSTGSPSLDRHLWGVQRGYLAGPGMIRMGPGFVSMLARLANLDIGVVVPTFRICRCKRSEEGTTHDCDMLKALVGGVLSGEFTKGTSQYKIPQFATVLFSMIMSDLASLKWS